MVRPQGTQHPRRFYRAYVVPDFCQDDGDYCTTYYVICLACRRRRETQPTDKYGMPNGSQQITAHYKSATQSTRGRMNTGLYLSLYAQDTYDNLTRTRVATKALNLSRVYSFVPCRPGSGKGNLSEEPDKSNERSHLILHRKSESSSRHTLSFKVNLAQFSRRIALQRPDNVRLSKR